MALFLKDTTSPPSDIMLSAPPLDLALPKHSLLPAPPPLTLFPNPYHFNRLSIGFNNPTLPICPPKFPSPPPISSILSPADPEAICEAAARILFMNVKWAKNVPAFASLSMSDRLILLEESWRELFIIGSAQFLRAADLRVLLDGKNSRIELKEVECFESAVNAVASLRPDSNEYSCLRAIVLFKTLCERNTNSPDSTDSEPRRLQDLPAIAALRDHSQIVLNEVIMLK